jgi:hypothetical protein
MTRQRTRQQSTLPDPARFGLASFAQLLSQREPLVGEKPETYEALHAGVLKSLNPGTPYEVVFAEGLIAIEWDLLQHRTMREACIRQAIKSAVTKALLEKERAEYDQAMGEAYNRHLEAGDMKEPWNVPYEIDERAVEEAAEQLINRATSRDPKVQKAAYAELSGLGMAALELLSAANRGVLGEGPAPDESPEYHDTKIRELERRRREVKRDYDQLRQSRPDVGAIIEQ